MAVAFAPARADTRLIILYRYSRRGRLESDQPASPGGVEVGFGRKAVAQLEDRHPVREREGGTREVCISAERRDHGRRGSVLAARSEEGSIE